LEIFWSLHLRPELLSIDHLLSAMNGPATLEIMATHFIKGNGMTELRF